MTALIKANETSVLTKTDAVKEKPAGATTSYAAVILDITGSMGQQIQGVKDAIQELLPLLAENSALGVVIITFTESNKGCYVSLDVFEDPVEADSFVRSIRLSEPPGNSGVYACGDDGDENAKAALFALTQLDGSMPTVAFFITDAGYHRTGHGSPTARKEQSYLEDMGVSDTDFFRLFDSVLAHFGENLIVVPVIYKFNNQPAHVVQAYGQIAMTSGGGVVIEPVFNTAQILALTMGTFVQRLLGHLNGQRDLPPAPPQEMLGGLHIYDTSGMTRVAQQGDGVGPRPRAGDGEQLFNSAMTRMVTAFKVAWKRCINVNKISLLRQLVFGLTAAKFVLAKTTPDSDIPVAVADNLMTRLRETFPALLEAMPEDQRGQIKATPEVIDTMTRSIAAGGSTSSRPGAVGGIKREAADAVSLETVREILETALEEELRVGEDDEEAAEAEPSSSVDPLGSVFAMVHGVLINVRFPPGVDGKPNFSDSWSAMIDRHAFDVVSAESAVRMFKKNESDSVAVGLTDRREYNGFVPLMDEADPLKTAVLRIFSGLQIMNLLQMTVLAGSPGGFLPNMYPGTLAAALARVIRTASGGSWAGAEAASTEANSRLASQMIFSLGMIMGQPATSERRRLENGKADPANPVSKFLLILCQQPRGNSEEEQEFRKKMRLVLDEWVATTIQLYFGKSTTESDEKFQAFIQEIVPLGAIFGSASQNVNPLERLHPLEEIDTRNGNAAPTGADGWKTGAIERLSKTELYDELQRLVGHCLVVFKCPDMNYDLDNTALNYTIYRFRTARYEIVLEQPPEVGEGSVQAKASDKNEKKTKATPMATTTAPSSSREPRGTHEPISAMPSVLGLVLQIHKKALHGELAAMKETRRAHAMEKLKARVVEAQSITRETRSLQFLGTVYTLGRIDVPALLQASGYDNLRFVEELVVGDWTPEPPQCLRRFAVEISTGVDEAGGGGEGGLSERLREAIAKRMVCLRVDRCNRHGHTADLPYPGPTGWTPDYERARQANLTESGRKLARVLPQMKRFTVFAAEVNKRLEEGAIGVADIEVKVRRILYCYDDANRLSAARAEVEELGVPALLEGL